MVVFLGIGVFAVLAAFGLAIPTATLTHVVAYLLATVAAFTAVALARRISLAEAVSSRKPEAPHLGLGIRSVVVTGFLVGAFHAWYIAKAIS